MNMVRNIGIGYTKSVVLKKLDRYNHTKLESEWWEVLEMINAFNLNQGVSQNFGNDVEVYSLREVRGRAIFI